MKKLVNYIQHKYNYSNSTSGRTRFSIYEPSLRWATGCCPPLPRSTWPRLYSEKKLKWQATCLWYTLVSGSLCATRISGVVIWLDLEVSKSASLNRALAVLKLGNNSDKRNPSEGTWSEPFILKLVFAYIFYINFLHWGRQSKYLQK